MSKINILFICLGNICRSPLAQGIFEEKIKQQGIQDYFFVDSAGTSGEHAGELPYHSSIREARRNGIDITKQTSRQVNMQDKDNFDYFIVMDQWNYANIVNDFQVDAKKVYKMREFDSIGKNSDVPDPWNQEDARFVYVFTMLDRCMDDFILFLREKHKI